LEGIEKVEGLYWMKHGLPDGPPGRLIANISDEHLTQMQSRTMSIHLLGINNNKTPKSIIIPEESGCSPSFRSPFVKHPFRNNIIAQFHIIAKPKKHLSAVAAQIDGRASIQRTKLSGSRNMKVLRQMSPNRQCCQRLPNLQVVSVLAVALSARNKMAIHQS
jgi:hypothetical protein